MPLRRRGDRADYDDFKVKGITMLEDLNPTTRKYPRRMEDAFQNSAEQAQWFYPPERKRNFASILLSVAGIAVWIGAIVLLIKA